MNSRHHNHDGGTHQKRAEKMNIQAQTQPPELSAAIVQSAHEAVEETDVWLGEYMSALVAGDFATAATYEADLLAWAGLVTGRVRAVVMEARTATRHLRRRNQPRDARGRFIKSMGFQPADLENMRN